MKIVIFKSDKDGKILVVNYCDYNLIMKREFENAFSQNHALTLNNCAKHFCTVRKKTETMVKNLHGLGLLDDEMLKHVLGKKLYGTEYHKISASKVLLPNTLLAMCQLMHLLYLRPTS